MRWPALLGTLFVGACGGSTPTPAGNITLTLDIPNAALDPKGYTDVAVRFHEPGGDVEVTTEVGADNAFDLGKLAKADNVSVEAVLLNASGAAVGYGRTASPVNLEADAEIVVPVRRPIVYIAGPHDASTMVDVMDWKTGPATFVDLTTGGTVDGSTRLGTMASLMIGAGPDIFMLEQPINSDGTSNGPASIQQVSTGDHSIAMPLMQMIALGDLQDGAGSDDGRWLVVGTSQKLYLIDTQGTKVMELASGDFAQTAVIASSDAGLTAIAIKRASPTLTCPGANDLIYITVSPDGTPSAMTVGTSGYTDVAAEAGQAYYVDACTNGGEFGSVSPTAPKSLRTNLGHVTQLAISEGQAFAGVEAPPSQLAVLVFGTATTEAPRTLWADHIQQVADAVDFQGVQRQLVARTVAWTHLEIGAGGDYVAASASADFEGLAVPEANFPKIDFSTEELWVYDGATGGVVQRYRSNCGGTVTSNVGDITNWGCATSPGQSAPASALDEHRIVSLAVLFGKK